MGFGSAFTSAWNKATAPIKEKVAQIATAGIGKAQNIIQKAKDTQQKAQAVGKFIEQQKEKIKEKAVVIAKQAIVKVAKKTENIVKKAVAIAKPKIVQLKKKAETKIKNTGQKINNAFKKIKKVFSPQNLVKSAVQICPFAKDGYNLAEKAAEGYKVYKNEKASTLSKSVSGVSLTIPTIKSILDIADDSEIIYKAARYGPDNPIKALVKSNVRQFSTNIALDLAIGGITGGLDAFARNVDRKDISKGDLAGIAAMGAAKGVTKAGLAAGMGAATGAVIGLAFGPGGAVVGAKLGATFLSPLFEKPAGWVTDKIFTEKGMGAIAGAALGATLGPVGLFNGFNLGKKYLSPAFKKPAEWAKY
jgi:membrane-associated HD superfamily phosphohydrolase